MRRHIRETRALIDRLEAKLASGEGESTTDGEIPDGSRLGDEKAQ